MDPYLEDNEHWHSFHHLLADEIMAQLNNKLSPRYYADVEIYTLLEEVGVATTAYPDSGILEVAPDQRPIATPVIAAPSAPLQRLALPAEEVKLRTVHIYVTETKQLVTAIELLSPVNKRGEGLTTYRQKRSRILRSNVHLLEIDLLRAGQRPGWELNTPPLDTDYVLVLNRAHDGTARMSEIWPIALNEPLPLLPVPLLPPDPDVILDLADCLHTVYQRGAYNRRIDYRQSVPLPPLRPAIATWLVTHRGAYVS
jgi:hypothetical protein